MGFVEAFGVAAQFTHAFGRLGVEPGVDEVGAHDLGVHRGRHLVLGEEAGAGCREAGCGEEVIAG